MAETYTVEKLPHEPIILVSMAPKYSVGRNMTDSDNDVRNILEASSEDLFVIADISHVSMSFHDVTLGSSKGARNQEALWHHSKIKKMIFISRANIVKLAAKGLNSPFFGNLDVKVFDTLEDAFAYCRVQNGMSV